MFSFRTGNGIGSRRRNSLLQPRGGSITQHLQSLAQRRRSHLVRQSLNRKLTSSSAAAASVESKVIGCCCCSSSVGSSEAMWWSRKQCSWRRISLALCLFGFLREIRPSEPFVTDFMIEPWRNLTIDDVRDELPSFRWCFNWKSLLTIVVNHCANHFVYVTCRSIATCSQWERIRMLPN